MVDTKVDRRHWRADSKEKKPYRTKKAAKRAAQKHMKPYKCPICRQYHLATKRKRTRNAP